MDGMFNYLKHAVPSCKEGSSSQNLKMDEACLKLFNVDKKENMTFWAQAKECYKVSRL